MPNILFVEDDKLIQQNYTDLLKTAGFHVTAVSDSASALEKFDPADTHLVILDVTLGDDSEAGFNICSKLRSISETLPIIFLTGLDSDIDKISGMRLGADDYITKDVSFEYLLVRIKALLRRIEILSKNRTEEQDELQRGDLVINMENLSAYWKNQKLKLSLTQLWMVHALISNRGYIRTNQQLMEAAKITIQPNTVAVHIRNIRQIFQAVDPDFSAIKSERSMGYRWVTDN